MRKTRFSVLWIFFSAFLIGASFTACKTTSERSGLLNDGGEHGGEQGGEQGGNAVEGSEHGNANTGGENDGKTCFEFNQDGKTCEEIGIEFNAASECKGNSTWACVDGQFFPLHTGLLFSEMPNSFKKSREIFLLIYVSLIGKVR